MLDAAHKMMGACSLRITGVVSNTLFDYYYPGYEDTAPLGHNTVCLLTEAARVNIAAPVCS